MLTSRIIATDDCRRPFQAVAFSGPLLFRVQQAALAVEAPAVASQPSITADDAVAGDDDGDAIGGAGAGDGAHGAGTTDGLRDFGIGLRAACGNGLQVVPNLELECGAVQ